MCWEMARGHNKAPIRMGRSGPVRRETFHAEKVCHKEQGEWNGNKWESQPVPVEEEQCCDLAGCGIGYNRTLPVDGGATAWYADADG